MAIRIGGHAENRRVSDVGAVINRTSSTTSPDTASNTHNRL
jgi:hypothetical protein